MKKLFLISAAIITAIPSVFATSDVEPVVVVRTENGPVRIPKSQFNEKQHELHVADEHHDEHGVARSNNPAPAVAPAAAVTTALPIPGTVADAAGNGAGTAPQPQQIGVLQNKGKFFIVNSDGLPVVNDMVDPKGYPSNAEAWAIVVKLQATPPAAS